MEMPLLPRLVELIAHDHDDDGERADDEVENVAIHRPGGPLSCLALDAGLSRREQIYRRTRSAPDLRAIRRPAP